MKQLAIFFLATLLFMSCTSNNTVRTDKSEKIDNSKTEAKAELKDLQAFELIWSDEFEYEGIPDYKEWKSSTFGYIKGKWTWNEYMVGKNNHFTFPGMS